jgi:hypothetical protein
MAPKAPRDCEEARGSDNGYVPGIRRHFCISARRASNDRRSTSARLRQAGAFASTILSTSARAGYGPGGAGQG